MDLKMAVEMKRSEEKGVAKESSPLKERCPTDSAWRRGVAAAFILTSAFLYFAAYDMPGSLQAIIEKVFGVKTQQFEYLYTFYGIPPIVICLFGGVLIDKVFGLYKGLICFVGLALLGQVVITVGGLLRAYWMMVLGRFVLGAGSESLIIALNCVIVQWFTGKEITLVFGMFQSLLRLGTTFAFSVATPLYTRIQSDVSVPPKYVFGLTLLPFLLVLILHFVNVTLLSFFTYRNFRQTSASVKSHGETVAFRQILLLPLKYWITSALLTISTSTIYAFVSCSQDLFTDKYKMDLVTANHYSTFFNFFTFASLPFVSFLINYVGYDLTFILAGCVLGIIGQLILFVTSWNPYLPLIIYSVSITLLNVGCMPLISMVVDETQVPTAYGVVQSGLNAVSASYQLIVGFLLEKYGPESTALFFMSCLVFGLLCTIPLFVINSRENGVLNLSQRQRRERNR